MNPDIQKIMDGLLADVAEKQASKFSTDLRGALDRLKAFTEAMAAWRQFEGDRDISPKRGK